MDKSLVSAIITTHNRLELLQRAVNSVFTQSYPNIELIVVNDGSDDGTDAWCKSLGKRIKYIQIDAKDSKGGNYARNLGIKEAAGVYIAFLDDDDYWIEDKIERQLDIALKNNCGVVYGGRILEIVSKKGVEYQKSLPLQEFQGNLKKKILRRTCTTTTTLFVKRSLLFEIGLFDENLKFWQEYELSIRLAQISDFLFVNDPVAYYRINADDPLRLTNKFYGWLDAVKYIRKKHSMLYQNLGIKDKALCMGFQYREAYWRAKNSGLKKESFKFFVYALVIDPFHTIKRGVEILLKK